MSLITQQAEELDNTRRALVEAVKLIRMWSGMGCQRGERERTVWGIYYCQSPEMAAIRDVLGNDPTQNMPPWRADANS